MLGSKSVSVFGQPIVGGAKVRLEVEEVTKDKKVIAFKFRRRKSSRRTRGFRRELTILRVKEILPGAELQPDFPAL
jgi:large subunit ribosomal protein L21